MIRLKQGQNPTRKPPNPAAPCLTFGTHVELSGLPKVSEAPLLQLCGLQYTSFFWDWLHSMLAIFLSRNSPVLALPTRWDFQCNFCFAFSASCNILLDSPCRESNPVIYCLALVALSNIYFLLLKKYVLIHYFQIMDLPPPALHSLSSSPHLSCLPPFFSLSLENKLASKGSQSNKLQYDKAK